MIEKLAEDERISFILKPRFAKCQSCGFVWRVGIHQDQRKCPSCNSRMTRMERINSKKRFIELAILAADYAEMGNKE